MKGFVNSSLIGSHSGSLFGLWTRGAVVDDFVLIVHQLQTGFHTNRFEEVHFESEKVVPAKFR